MSADLTLDQACSWLREAVELRRDRTVGVALRDVAAWFGLTEKRAAKLIYREATTLRDSERDIFRSRYVAFLRAEAKRRTQEAQVLEFKAAALDAKAARLRQRREKFRADAG